MAQRDPPTQTTTIAAVASPPGPGRRGVVRLSGPQAGELVRRTVRPRPDLTRRGVSEGEFDDGVGEQPVWVFWMPAPASYTREDVVELHLPGAPPLLRAALARLVDLGAEPAAPGEFTRRAFLNGRLDLTRAEGVIELIEATNERERRSATELLTGGLARRVEGLRESLEEVRTLAEASLDFDEADTGHVPLEELVRRADVARDRLRAALTWEVRRQPPSALPRVVLFGLPNAGKSTLFNRLTAGAALVSDQAGTTRDALTGLWPLAEGACLLLDAPGLESGPGSVERRAQELAERERAAADLALWVVDAQAGVEPAAAEILAAARAALPAGLPVLLVWSRVDRHRAAPRPPDGLVQRLGLERWVATSAHTGTGLEALAGAATAALGAGPADGAGAPVGRELFARHRRALERALVALDQGRGMLEDAAPLDQTAEALRQATDELDAVLGRTDPEDLLERIFARFCIGK